MDETDDPFADEWPAGQMLPVPADVRRCVWCQSPLGPAEGQGLPSAPAVCDACTAVLVSGERESLASFIEKVDAPVLVVTGDGRARGANARARVYLGKAADEIVGQLAGEVIECLHAGEPGGCGQTVHCSGCTLRRSVQHTHLTGEPLHGVHAYQDVQTASGIRKAWLELTTERAGELVLLRIEALGIERRV